MRQITGSGTPKQAASGENTLFVLLFTPHGAVILLVTVRTGDPGEFWLIALVGVINL